MKSVLLVLLSAGFFLMTSCSHDVAQASWIPVVTGPPMPPVSEQDVLLMDDYPIGEYVSVGRLEPVSASQKHPLQNEENVRFLKQKAAAMGGNTVVVKENPLKFKSGKGGGSKIDVIYVREEVGTHGGEDWSGDAVPLNEDLLKIY